MRDIEAEWEQVTARKTLSKLMLTKAEIKVAEDQITGDLVYELSSYLLAHDNKAEVIKSEVTETLAYNVPETWWDHFKMTMLPEWFRNRWPCRMRSLDRVISTEIHITHRHLCPHHDIPFDGSRRTAHLKFLVDDHRSVSLIYDPLRFHDDGREFR